MKIEKVTITAYEVNGIRFSSEEDAERYLKGETEIKDKTVEHNLVPGEWYYAPQAFLDDSEIYDQIDPKKAIVKVQFVEDAQIETYESIYFGNTKHQQKVRISRLYFKTEQNLKFLLWDTALINTLCKDYTELFGFKESAKELGRDKTSS